MTPPQPRRRSLIAQIRAVGGLVVAVVNTKGGSRKSTTVYNVAHELAQRGGHVLVLDTDLQQTLVDAAAVRTIAPRVTVLPYPHVSLWEDLEHLRAGYDVVVIDGHGRHDQITRAAIAAAARDRHGVILVPVGASPAEVWATRRDTAPILAEVAAAVPWKLRVRMVLTGYDPHELITASTYEALAAADIAPTAAAGLQRRTVYVQALNVGQAVCEYQPGGPAAAEVAALTTEIVRLALSDPQPREQEENP